MIDVAIFVAARCQYLEQDWISQIWCVWCSWCNLIQNPKLFPDFSKMNHFQISCNSKLITMSLVAPVVPIHQERSLSPIRALSQKSPTLPVHFHKNSSSSWESAKQRLKCFNGIFWCDCFNGIFWMRCYKLWRWPKSYLDPKKGEVLIRNFFHMCTVHRASNYVYRTQVSLVRSMGPESDVCHWVSEWRFWNLTDVTLADGDTKSLLREAPP